MLSLIEIRIQLGNISGYDNNVFTFWQKLRNTLHPLYKMNPPDCEDTCRRQHKIHICDDLFGRVKEKKTSFSERLLKIVSSPPTSRCFLRRVPLISTLASYDVRRDLFSDIFSGISVGLSSIPQAMGYASILNMPIQYGLYGIIFPSLIFSLFTSSIHASSTINIAGVIFVNDALENLGYNDIITNNKTNEDSSISPEQRNDAIFGLTFIAGVTLVVAMLLRFGVVLRFNSEPYMTAVFGSMSLVIIITQLPALFGVVTEQYTGFMQTPKLLYNLLTNIDETNTTTIVIAVIIIITIVTFKEFLNPLIKQKCSLIIPIDVVVIICSIILSMVFDWNDKHSVDIIGYIPSALPKPKFPLGSNWTDLLKEGIVVGILTYLGSPVLIKLFGINHGYKVDTDQEALGLGVALSVSSVFSCGGLGVSSPRLMMMVSSGGRTQVAYVFAALSSLGAVLFLSDYMEYLPSCSVSAIIICSSYRFHSNFARLKKYWKNDKLFFLVWWFTFLIGICSSVTNSVLYGIILNIFISSVQSLTSQINELQQASHNNKRYFLEKQVYTSVSPVLQNLNILAVDGAIFFGNSEKLTDSVMSFSNTKYSKTSESIDTIDSTYQNGGFHCDMDSPNNNIFGTSQHTSNLEHNCLILDLKGVNFIDLSAIKQLLFLKTELKREFDCSLRLSGSNEAVRASLSRSSTAVKHLFKNMYLTIEDAINGSNDENVDEDAEYIDDSENDSIDIML